MSKRVVDVAPSDGGEGRARLQVRAITAALLMSMLLNAMLAYRLIDVGVTLTHVEDEREYLDKQRTDANAALRVLLPTMSRAEALDALRKARFGLIEKPDEGAVYAGSVRVVFAEGHVSAIELP